MGGRKRKKVLKKPPKRLPSVFACPNCGNKSISIDVKKDEEKAEVKCGICGIRAEVMISTVEDAVDAYGKFIDDYYQKRELITARR